MRYFTPFYTQDKEYIVGFSIEDVFNDYTTFDFRSSYHVLGARLMGLPYHEFLLYCAKKYNGVIRGKKGYTHLAFKERDDCNKLCYVLEDHWRRVLKDVDLV